MAVPYTFGSATTSIPLSQLDSNFATAITLGNTAVQLGNTITSLTGVSNVASATSLSLGSNGNTTAVTIDTSQNVGIGVVPNTSNQKTIELGSSGNVITTNGANDIQIAAGAYYNSSWKYAVTGSAVSNYYQDNGNHVWRYAASGTTGNSFTYTEAARIDSNGNLLVGTTSDPNGGGIAVYKSTNGATIANFQNTYSGSGGQAIRGKINSAGNNTSSYLFVGSSNNDVCYIYGNGNIVNINNSYGTLSDVKLKENIIDATPKLAEVMQLKVRNFNLKTEPDHKQIGFIAQELEQVFPALIDNTTSPNDPDDVIKSIKTSVLVPILVKAIQELKAINDQQAETINALTARIVALEAK
jgi:Chaperone of endosialidase